MKLFNKFADIQYKLVLVFFDRLLAILYTVCKATKTNFTIEEFVKEYNTALCYIVKTSSNYKS